MRCPMCGKKMARTQIDKIICWQCPGKTCRWVEPAEQKPEGAAVAETGEDKTK